MTLNLRAPPGIGDATVRLALLGGCLLHSAALATGSNFQIGILACEAAQGSSNTLICDFHAEDRPPEAYAGIADTDFSSLPKVEWTVVTVADEVQSGDLAGEYVAKGKTGLVGGHAKSITLQPVALTGPGTKPAPDIEKLTLIASN